MDRFWRKVVELLAGLALVLVAFDRVLWLADLREGQMNFLELLAMIGGILALLSAFDRANKAEARAAASVPVADFQRQERKMLALRRICADNGMGDQAAQAEAAIDRGDS